MKSDLLHRYEHSPVLRGLAQLVPYAGASFDSAIGAIANNMREKRQRIFFDELEASGRLLTEDELRNEDFVHAFFATYGAALRTKHEEKIRLFAHILANQAPVREASDGDRFEETLAVLDDLSVRELHTLQILAEYEAGKRGTNDGSPRSIHATALARTFWSDFCLDIATMYRVPIGDVSGILERLKRTGLYQADGGADGDPTIGHLTSNYIRFIGALTSSGD